MKKATLVIITLINLLSFSQSNYNSESFQVTLPDIKNAVFDKDSTANAFVIYEEGNSYIDKDNYELVTEVKHKIKILNKEGFNNGTITVHLFNNKQRSEKVERILATTYNLINNEVIKTELQEKGIFTEKYDDNHTTVKFTLPNLQPGSVITYSYTLMSPFMFKYKEWEFQSDIPKIYSEYRTSIPGFWLYHIKLVGGKKLTTHTSEIKKNCIQLRNGASADCGCSIYAMKDIPAFVNEDYMTSRDNYLARVEYELETYRGPDGLIKNYTKEWKDVDKEFRTEKDIGRQLRKKIAIEEILPMEIIAIKNNLDKAKAIYNFVQHNYKWNGEFKIFKDVSIKNLLKERTGNVSSINILLHNLLIQAGIDANPVLISTRENGFPTTIFPVIYDFNYLIVQSKIDDKEYLLDATDNFLNFGQIPFRCLNQIGRRMDFENGSEWIDINPEKYSTIQYQAELKFNNDNTLGGKITSRTTGYYALRDKKEYYNDKEGYIEALSNENAYNDIFNFEVIGNQTDENFTQSYEIEYSSDQSTANNIYLNPFFIKFLKENPFKLQERTFPVDFGYKIGYNYSLKINIGEQYVVKEKPHDLHLFLPDQTGDLLFATKSGKGFIQLILKVTFRKSIYEPEYYTYLKDLMSKVIDIQNNSIFILEKL